MFLSSVLNRCSDYVLIVAVTGMYIVLWQFVLDIFHILTLREHLDSSPGFLGFFFGGISITHLFICPCYLFCFTSFCLLCLILPVSVLYILFIPTAVFSSVNAYMDIMIFNRTLLHCDTYSYLFNMWLFLSYTFLNNNNIRSY